MSNQILTTAGISPLVPWSSPGTHVAVMSGRAPAPLSTLIGRESLLAVIDGLLGRDDVRLITLTGPGGVGKTRLALAVAADTFPAIADEVAFVPLAPIRNATLVAAAIADCLDVREGGGSPLAEDLIAHLRIDRFLLILDNFEHLLDATPLVFDLLAACPTLKVLATSRRRLHLSGEHEVQIPPLALADPNGASTIEELADVPAIQLFVARAQASSPSFALTAANGPLIAEICQRLDGLPLAIELAAPRTRLLSPAALLSRLTNRLQLLTGGPRDMPERLQTMRSAIAWSYDLLDPAGQTLLRQLAVFVGGFTLDGAEWIAGGGGVDATSSVFESIATLVDESLLQTSPQPAGDWRFSMLETVREYALERLTEAGEEPAARRCHATYGLSLVEQIDAGQAIPQTQLDRLQAEQDNVRAALAWSMAHDPELALRLAGGLWRFWSQRGYWSEGRGWLEQALAVGALASPAWRAIALYGAGKIANEQADFAAARHHFEESWTLAQQIRDDGVATRALHGLGIVASNQSDFDRAVELFEVVLQRLRVGQDQLAISRCLNDLGLVADRRGDQERAIAYYEEALPLARASSDHLFASMLLSNLGGAYINTGDWARGEALTAEALDQSRTLGDQFGTAVNLYNLGDCVRQRGEVTRAWEQYRESLGITHDLGERHLASRILDRLAHLMVTSGLPRPAAHLLSAAATQRRQIGDTLFPTEEAFVAEAIATTRAALGDEAFQVAWEAGASLTLDQAVAEALAVDLPPGSDEHPARLLAQVRLGLTTREVEVLRLVAAGWADKEIASALAISRHTASKHVAAVRVKLAAPSRTAAVAAAREAGLL